jgi:Fe-S cluster assembly protein SufD
MPAAVETRATEQSYLAAFAKRRPELGGPPRLTALRDIAIERFARLGFPTIHNEDWKYTNLAPMLRAGFEHAAAVRGESVAERLAAAPFADLGCPRAVFVNGRFSPELSTLPAASSGVKVGKLWDAEALGSVADIERNAMVALNTALFEDGAFVEIAARKVLEQPLHLVFLAVADGRPSAAYPRTLVVAGRDSQAQIVETYLTVGEGESFTNAVTEFIAGDGAVVEHYKLQTESHRALHFGMLAVRQGASSQFTSRNIALGAALARNEITAVLEGEGADAVLDGLYLTAGGQHVDNHTTLDHARPHTTSHELYKGILDGKSQGVFHGRIIVRPEAQKTDAIQRNKNLLLSEAAVINTKPQLEIYADDVKCTHGATVGQVDPDAVFYLRSRGIPRAEARALLTYAFTAELIDRIGIEAIRAGLGQALFRRLAGEGTESHGPHV